MTAPRKDLISVVVIGRNEGERLRRCLRSVFAMVRRDLALEVIYVDSGSEDDSVALAKEEGAKTIALMPERPSAALGRNVGWRAARGSIVLFLDGDTVLHPEFVTTSLPEFSSDSVAVIWDTGGSFFPIDQSTIARSISTGSYAPGFTEYCGGDALFRRSVLVKTNGFDASLIAGEEPELCRRIRALGFDILHVDRAMTGHDLAITRWSQYWKRCTRAGHAFAEVSQRFRNTDAPFWSKEAMYNRNRFFAIMLSLLAAVAGSIFFRSPLPIAIYGVFFMLFSMRSAWKASWKSDDRIALMLYGVHSHLQQIPIYFGQLQYKWSHKRGMRPVLFEYK